MSTDEERKKYINEYVNSTLEDYGGVIIERLKDCGFAALLVEDPDRNIFRYWENTWPDHDIIVETIKQNKDLGEYIKRIGWVHYMPDYTTEVDTQPNEKAVVIYIMSKNDPVSEENVWKHRACPIPDKIVTGQMLKAIDERLNRSHLQMIKSISPRVGKEIENGEFREFLKDDKFLINLPLYENWSEEMAAEPFIYISPKPKKKKKKKKIQTAYTFSGNQDCGCGRKI